MATAAAPQSGPIGSTASGADTGVTFALEDEDHTLANALRFMLNKNPHVSFCGYSIPHPATPVVHLRVQTTGEISASEAVRQACHNLKLVCAHVKETFREDVERFKAENAGSDMDEQ